MRTQLRFWKTSAWNVGGVGVSHLIILAMTAYLARHLDARDFGYMAIAMLAIEFGRDFVMAGIPDLLVRARSWNASLARSGFSFQLALGIAFAAACAAIGFAVGSLGEGEIGEAMILLSIIFPLEALGAVSLARLRFDHLYRKVAQVQVAGNLAMLLSAVLSIEAGYGFLAIVHSRIVCSAVCALGYLLVAGWVPRLSMDAGPVRENRAALSHIIGTRVLSILNVKSADFIIGMVGGAPLLGAYQLAVRILSSFLQVLLAPVQAVMLSTLRDQEADEDARVRTLDAFRGLAILIFPIAAGTIAVAREAVAVLLGDNWGELVLPTAILMLALIPASINYLLYPVAVRFENARLAFRFTGLLTVMGIVLTLLATPFGLVAVAAAFVARTTIGAIICLAILKHALGFRVWPFLAACIHPALGAVAIIGLIALARNFLVVESELLALCIYVPLGVCAYALLMVGPALHFWRQMRPALAAGDPEN